MPTLEGEVRLNLAILRGPNQRLRERAEARLVRLRREFDLLKGWEPAESDPDFLRARDLLKDAPSGPRCDCCGQSIATVRHRGDLVLGPECAGETELHSCKRRD